MFEPDPAKADFSAPENPEKEGSLPTRDHGGKSDLAELAAKFTVHGGGKVSAELSADLALEVVLNEIVEQACVETGATGAAIVLERGGEWVCRASAGETAPELGSRLDSETGLSGACVKTRTIQRCDDAQSDPQADIEASRNLGVRSVMILPLMLNDQLVGVFEVFSAAASAFGVPEEIALGTLAQRAVQNMEWASAAAQEDALQPGRKVYPTMAELIVEDLRVAEMSEASASAENFNVPTAREMGESATEKPHATDPIPNESFEGAEERTTEGRAIRVLTWVLGVMVLSAAVLLAVAMVLKLSGRTMARRHGQALVRAAARNGREQSSGPGAGAPIGTKSIGPTTGPAAPSSGTHAPAPPAGGLAVYEKGKEIFRLPPQRESDVGSGASLPASSDDGVLHRVEPVYPEAARAQGIEGAVVADVFIDQEGKVVDVKTVSGAPVLAQAVSDAVKQWVFKPRGVPMETRVTLNFRLPH
jgi:TonB family protein